MKRMLSGAVGLYLAYEVVSTIVIVASGSLLFPNL
jgi:hypothetical protein